MARAIFAPMLAGGSSANLIAAFNGRLCGLEDEYPCRHVNVTASSSGTLILDAAGDDPTARFLFGPVSYPLHASAHAEVPVTAGQTIPVEILWQWSEPAASWYTSRFERFALTTSIR